jgi:hypothetical protein
MTRTVSVAELRRHVVAAQGYAARSRRGRPAEVAATVARLSAVQLDSISTVDRSHRITLASRVGAYPRATVSRLLGNGTLFEFWAHECCLLPIADWPLYRHVMVNDGTHPWWGAIIEKEPQLADQVLGEIRERGPLGSRDFEGQRGTGMWSLKPAKRMLEALWTAGSLVIAGRQEFQRLYDLPERVLPDEVLGAPVPGADEYMRTLIVRAVKARGALTESGVVEHNRLRGGVARIRPHVDHLVSERVLDRLAVADGGAPVLVEAGAAIGSRTPTAAALLSPFDNLLWDRPFAQRVLGFDHLIEVYKRPHERQYGYYVLPFVHGDRIVGRADLKTDRAAGELRLLAFYPEPRVRWTASREEALDKALARLADAVGVSSIVRA